MIKNFAISWLLLSSGAKTQEFNPTTNHSIWHFPPDLPVVRHAYLFDIKNQINKNLAHQAKNRPFQLEGSSIHVAKGSFSSIRCALACIANTFGTAAGQVQNWAVKIDRMLPNFLLPVAQAASVQQAENLFEQYSYNKGDDAKSIDGFREAVKGEYAVFSNENAYIEKKFNEKVIMIYGEKHDNPLFPSIRNGKGAFLLESKKLEGCLQKHTTNPQNICKNIDLSDLSKEIDSFESLYEAGTNLLFHLDQAELEKVDNKVINGDDNITVLTNEIVNFVRLNYKRIYSSKTSSERKVLRAAKIKFDNYLKQCENVVQEGLSQRDLEMAKEATKIIKTLKNGQTATITVGGHHALPIYNALKTSFPNHAVVMCVPLSRHDKNKNELILREAEKDAQWVKGLIKSHQRETEL